MASSISLPMVVCLALAWRCDQRASLGTQNTFSARYSSGSSAADGSSASKEECLASNASEMYFRKIRPSTTCLYSDGSRFPRSLSAARNISASKPRLAPFGLALPFFLDFLFGAGCPLIDPRTELEGMLLSYLSPPLLWLDWVSSGCRTTCVEQQSSLRG